MKRLIQFSSLVLILGIAVQSCIIRKEKGNKEILSKEYTIADYSAIIAKGSFDITYEQKKGAPYLRVETDSNMFDYIDIDSDGSELEIELDDSANPSLFKVYTNSPELAKIRLSGAGSLTLKGSLLCENLSISCSGSNKISIEDLNTLSLEVADSGSFSIAINKLIAQKLSIKSSGSTKVKAEGKVDEAKFDMSGSGKVEALNLQTQTTKCNISGSGSITINCERELNVTISGSGNVRYTGEARINQKISGSGKIEKI